MRVFLPMNGDKRCWNLAIEHPTSVGILVTPSLLRTFKYKVSFAVDNDAYKAFKKDEPWNEKAFFGMLDKVSKLPCHPLWVLVPDVVGNRDETLWNWDKYAHRVHSYGFPLAFAVQDGMTCSDIPEGVTVFVGGSTAWKWKTAPFWCASFPTHIGRVNSLFRLQRAEELGAVSTDGSGWLWPASQRYWASNLSGLRDWLQGWRNKQTQLPL